MPRNAINTDHKRGFLRSNGVEVSVLAMLAGLGVAIFLLLTILGGKTPTEAVETDDSLRQGERSSASQEPAATIGGAGLSESTTFE